MIKVNQIIHAHNRIKPFINKTPILKSENLNKIFNAVLYFKCENFQKTGSFKYRGAINTIEQLDKIKLKNGVVTASSGNHGAALSKIAKDLNIACSIIIPKKI